MPSFTTDIPFQNNPETEETSIEAQRETGKAPRTAQLDQLPSTLTESPCTSTETAVSPEAIRPFGKAPPRNLQRKRKSGKWTVWMLWGIQLMSCF